MLKPYYNQVSFRAASADPVVPEVYAYIIVSTQGPPAPPSEEFYTRL